MHVHSQWQQRQLLRTSISTCFRIPWHVVISDIICARIAFVCVCVIEKESYFPFAYTDTESTHTDLKLSSDRYAPYLSM